MWCFGPMFRFREEGDNRRKCFLLQSLCTPYRYAHNCTHSSKHLSHHALTKTGLRPTSCAHQMTGIRGGSADVTGRVDSKWRRPLTLPKTSMAPYRGQQFVKDPLSGSMFVLQRVLIPAEHRHVYHRDDLTLKRFGKSS